jgi:hypothetical protein
MPYRAIAPRPAAAAAPPARTSPRKRAAKSRPPEPATAAGPTPTPRVKVDPGWPLPVPDEVAMLLDRCGRYEQGPRPHPEVLLEIAIAARKPDEVLGWFDRMRVGRKDPGFGHYDHSLAYADRVAAAVADAYPERAIEIYRAALEAKLPHADYSSYVAAADYLKTLRPLFEAVGRPGEWAALLGSVRERHRNRPRFMELLDGLDGRTIAQTSRPRRK